VCDVTVAICTYRRTEILAETLSSLASIDRPEIGWEILVVDNACDEAVEQIVEGFRNRLTLRYVAEPKVGIAQARNRAVNETNAPIILFADDDVVFDKQWLCAMVGAVCRHGECDFWGGRIEPSWTVPKPAWFDIEQCPTLGDSIVRYDAGGQPRPWDPQKDHPFYTCSLALRTDAVRRAGMFDTTLGHQGEKRGGGEDSWMIRTISNAGGKGWYAADALLLHPVPPERLTRKHARAFAWWQGRVGVEMLRREHPDASGVGRVPRWLYPIAARQCIAGIGRWIAGAVGRNPGKAFAGQFTALFNLSKLVHAMRR